MSPYSGNCWTHGLEVFAAAAAAAPGVVVPLVDQVKAKYKRIEKIITAQQIPSALPI